MGVLVIDGQRDDPDSAQYSRAVWGLCPGCGQWQVCVAEDAVRDGDVPWSAKQVVDVIDEAFRDHARHECPGLAELIAVRGMGAKPAPVIYPG